MRSRLEAWLARQLRQRRIACWVGAVLALAAGLLVVCLTFWLAYAVLFIAEQSVAVLTGLVWSRPLRLGHAGRLVLCGLFIVALFWEWRRRSPWSLGQYGQVDSSQRLVSAFARRAGLAGGLVALLANPEASATLISELLYTGPRLVLGAGHLVRAARQLAGVDVRASAWVLECLLKRSQAVTYEELTAAWPEADWPGLRQGLAAVPGVVFLEKGLGLTADLREELEGVVNG